MPAATDFQTFVQQLPEAKTVAVVVHQPASSESADAPFFHHLRAHVLFQAGLKLKFLSLQNTPSFSDSWRRRMTFSRTTLRPLGPKVYLNRALSPRMFDHQPPCAGVLITKILNVFLLP